MKAASGERSISVLQAIIYASGYFGVQLTTYSLGQIPQLFYVPPKEAPLLAGIAALSGITIFGILNGIGRFTDGLVDPWIGNWSDYFRSKYGRRKPFIMVGAPLTGMFLILFTLPPTETASVANLIWLAIIYPLFFIFYTIMVTPYLAMIPEIARTSSDRLLITSFQSIFLILGTFAGIFIIGAIGENGFTFTKAAILVAVLTCIPLFIMCAMVKIPHDLAPEEIPDRPSVFVQVKEALSFKPFRIYLLSIVAFFFGFEMIRTSAGYIAEFLFHDRGAYTIMLGLAMGVATIFAPIVYFAGKKIGKRRSMHLMCGLFILFLPLVGLIGKMPFENAVMGYLLFASMGIPISILLVVPNSLLADIIDLNNKKTGKNREGLFFASQALVNKVGIGFSVMVLNLILSYGSAPASHGGEHVVTEAGVRLVGPIAAFFVLIGVLIFLRFPDIEKTE